MRLFTALWMWLALCGVAQAQDEPQLAPHSSGSDAVIVCGSRFDSERIVLDLSARLRMLSFVPTLYEWAATEIYGFREWVAPFIAFHDLRVSMPQCFATAPVPFLSKTLVHSRLLDRNGSLVRIDVSEALFKGQHLWVVEANLSLEL
jgi:N-acetyl-gamma-glutamylphosphate reductase